MADPYGLELSGLDPETSEELRRLRRQQQVADELAGRSQMPLQGHMAGRVYIPPSWAQGAANMLNAYGSRRMSEDIDKGYQSFSDKRKALEEGERSKIIDVMTGKPEEVLPTGVYGPPQPEVPAGGRQQIIQAMLQSRLPEYRRTAEAMLIKEKTAAAESPWAKIDPKDYTPESVAAYATSRNPADLRALSKPTGKMGTEDIHIGGGQWQTFKVGADGQVDLGSPIGSPFAKRPTASTVSSTVNMPKADSKYAETRLEDAAKEMKDRTKSAESAFKANRALDSFLKASKEGTEGGAQPVITATQNFLSSFGYKSGALKDVAQMEMAIGEILGAKMAELGARGLTDRDMDVLRQALPRVATSRDAREAVVGILKKSNDYVIAEWESHRQSERDTYPELDKRIPEPLWYKDYKKSRAAAEPAGAAYSDAEKERRYQEWKARQK